AVEDDAQRLAANVFHHHPRVALGVGLQVVERDEIGVLQVEALRDAAQLDVVIGAAAQQLERDLLAAVADGEVDLAEAAAADAALQDVAVQRSLPGAVGELHTSLPHAVSRRV